MKIKLFDVFCICAFVIISIVVIISMGIIWFVIFTFVKIPAYLFVFVVLWGLSVFYLMRIIINGMMLIDGFPLGVRKK
jgi:hypothetical protein